MHIDNLAETALLIKLGDSADEVSAARVLSLMAAFEANPLRGVYDIVPSYHTIAVHYDYSVATRRVRDWIEACTKRRIDEAPIQPRTITIPVCYAGEFAPDLGDVAANAGMCAGDIAAIHAAGIYTVRAVGFVPGFAYLAGLDPAIASPRRGTPRTHVPAGSVGIAGPQTGVYPLETPGGWQIIGRTPLAMFRPKHAQPSRLAVGNIVRFDAITAEQFRAFNEVTD
jgi:inhibitor of KinA